MLMGIKWVTKIWLIVRRESLVAIGKKKKNTDLASHNQVHVFLLICEDLTENTKSFWASISSSPNEVFKFMVTGFLFYFCQSVVLK